MAPFFLEIVIAGSAFAAVSIGCVQINL
jgi:hypothetical protein